MTDVDVLFVEDDPILRSATEDAIRLDGLVVTSCPDAQSALAHIDISFPGVVVSDIHLRGVDGVSLLREVKEADPEIPVILVADNAAVAIVVKAMQLGARNVIEKPFDVGQLLQEIHSALTLRRASLHHDRHAAWSTLASLTPREREMVDLVGQGMTNAEIAAATGIAEGTVKRHLTHSFNKLGVTNRAQLVRALLEWRLRRPLP